MDTSPGACGGGQDSAAFPIASGARALRPFDTATERPSEAGKLTLEDLRAIAIRTARCPPRGKAKSLQMLINKYL
jgi:hypothetical protein